jgi:hypothetical protein
LVKDVAGLGGPDSRQELQHAEAGDAVARVLGKAQAGEHVLDMGAVDEFEPAELDEENAAHRKLDLESVTTAAGSRNWVGSTRRVISTAARRENVISRMRPGSAPLATRCTTRCARVAVLPDRATAISGAQCLQPHRRHAGRRGAGQH